MKFVKAKITKRRKKRHPLWVNPPNNAYTPYFEEFQTKQAPNFTLVEDLVVTEDPTQTVETFLRKNFESFI